MRLNTHFLTLINSAFSFQWWRHFPSCHKCIWPTRSLSDVFLTMNIFCVYKVELLLQEKTTTLTLVSHIMSLWLDFSTLSQSLNEYYKVIKQIENYRRTSPMRTTSIRYYCTTRFSFAVPIILVPISSIIILRIFLHFFPTLYLIRFFFCWGRSGTREREREKVVADDGRMKVNRVKELAGSTRKHREK